MATIDENLEIIEKGVYGRDVRQAIHDAIEQTSDLYGANITSEEIAEMTGTLYERVTTTSVISVGDNATVDGTTLILEGA